MFLINQEAYTTCGSYNTYPFKQLIPPCDFSQIANG